MISNSVDSYAFMIEQEMAAEDDPLTNILHAAVKYGHMPIVQYLIEDLTFSINELNAWCVSSPEVAIPTFLSYDRCH